jgi:hypothetical protein
MVLELHALATGKTSAAASTTRGPRQPWRWTHWRGRARPAGQSENAKTSKRRSHARSRNLEHERRTERLLGVHFRRDRFTSATVNDRL